jgi:predicted RNA-binding protein with PIN domain
MGGKFHLKLNNGERPIANKYREGKMKRTLKRELKVLEIAKREALATSDMRSQSLVHSSGRCRVVGQTQCGVVEKVVAGSTIACQSRSIRAVGEGSEKGRMRQRICYILITLPRLGLRK